MRLTQLGAVIGDSSIADFAIGDGRLLGSVEALFLGVAGLHGQDADQQQGEVKQPGLFQGGILLVQSDFS